LLSNILLDELNMELEHRGHKFCRYADECNIYVLSERAGKSVMDSIERFLNKRLKLKINRQKSIVDRPQERQFLGLSFTSYKFVIQITRDDDLWKLQSLRAKRHAWRLFGA